VLRERGGRGGGAAGVRDSGAGQEVARVDEQPLEDQVDREHGFVPAQRVVALLVARG
jgi:hypothetical protein